ncbi:hypothetical protein BH09BAC5_BH09BAC5_12230 [soil metagenome]
MNYDYPAQPPTEDTGKEIWKVMRLQLAIFAGYQILLALLCQLFYHGAFLILDMLPLLGHWILLLILMIVSFSKSKRGAGLGYLISLIIIVIIGFGSCFAIGNSLGGGLGI